MDNIGYILASRQIALFKQQDRIADQVANANTVAFKLERDIMDQAILDGGNAGKMAFTEVVATTRDNSAGAYQITERPLDVAIYGDGYFVVETPLGERYTRAGSFVVDAVGDLVTAQGYRVLGLGGDGTNFAPEDTGIRILEDGTVLNSEGEIRGQLGVFRFDDSIMLERVGENMYRSPVAAEIAETATVAQGMLEGSNVNMISQMTELMTVSRAIERTKRTLDKNHELEIDTIRRIARV